MSLVPEWEFVEWFPSCEMGAEPPLALYGMPIYADAALAITKRVVMPAGTHDDTVVLDTSRWIECEGVSTVVGLGVPMH